MTDMRILQAASLLGTLAVALAVASPLAGQIDESPPIIFVHGNGDSAALWITTLWRFESNGYDPRRLFAIDMRHPAAPARDTVSEDNRSSTADQMAQLAEAVDRVLLETGQNSVVLVGNSRGGNTIRNYIKNAGGHAQTAIAILCGTPNHGIVVSDGEPDSEWNGHGRFLRDLNDGSEVHPDVRFVTIRSDTNDKYAQPGQASRTGVTGGGYDSPALDGAENIVLDGLDHREVAYHPRAFREMYRVITGREPTTVDPVPEARPELDGVVSGFANGDATNLPLAGATVAVYEVDPNSGSRLGTPVHQGEIGDSGQWGPFAANPTAFYELVAAAEGYPTLHVYHSPFPRSTRHVNLRLQPVNEPERDAESFVAMSRPRGYFGHGRDRFTIDGTVPEGVVEGVPTTSWITRRFPAGPSRPVRLRFNDETITVRTFPLADGHLVIGEFHN